MQQAAGSRPQQSELVYCPSADTADAVMVSGWRCFTSVAACVGCELAGANKILCFKLQRHPSCCISFALQ